MFRDTNSIFAVLIKAGDKLHSQDEESSHDESIIWKNMSEKEKEIEVCIRFLKFYTKQTEDDSSSTPALVDDNSSDESADLHQPLPDRQCCTIS